MACVGRPSPPSAGLIARDNPARARYTQAFLAAIQSLELARRLRRATPVIRRYGRLRMMQSRRNLLALLLGLAAGALLSPAARAQPAPARDGGDSLAGAAPLVQFPTGLSLRLDGTSAFESERSGARPAEPAGQALGPVPRSLGGQTGWAWGSVSTRVAVKEPLDPAEPRAGEGWQTEEALRLRLGGPFSVFGQLGAHTDATMPQEPKLAGRTGLAWKLPSLLGGDVQVRGGPVFTCDDPLHLEPPRPELFVELQGRWPVVGPLNLEYQGSATPALAATEREQLTQDVRFELPVGSAGRVRLGAKRSWENVAGARPWIDHSQLYVGLEMKR
jgi:hypothetical protein